MKTSNIDASTVITNFLGRDNSVSASIKADHLACIKGVARQLFPGTQNNCVAMS